MVVPALLTDDRNTLSDMLYTCKDFCDYVQIDIMDGEFVPSKSIHPHELKDWKSPLGCEAHLMVCDPLPWVVPFKEFGASRIIYHFETGLNHEKVIETIHKEGLSAGLAVNPGTELTEFADLVPSLDFFLFMSVIPGFYGSKFIPGVLSKIKEFRKKFPGRISAIDGGVKEDNIREVKKSGVDIICVGSAVLKSENPAAAYNNLRSLIDE